MLNLCEYPEVTKTGFKPKVVWFLRSTLLAIFLLQSAAVYSQDAPLNDYTYLIDRKGGGYSGPGIEWILENVEDKQFLLFGEPHGVEDVPRLVEDMYMRLQSQGFKHLVLEIDATTAQQLKELPLTDFIAKYPHSIAFDYDGELQLMEKVQSTYSDEQVIWGMDQMIVAIHPFQMLAKVAKTVKTRRICRGLHLKATLKGGRYISQKYFADLDQLEKLFEKEQNQEGLSIVSQIRTSMEIYVAYFAATRGEISYQFSSDKRERYMMQWFDDFVNKAEQGGALPRAIVKMGGAHTTYGIGPNGVLTMGDHLDKLAKKAGGSNLSLGLAYAPEDATFPPKALFEGKSAVLIDHNAMLNDLDSASLSAYPEELVRRLRYFDASIYLNDPVRSVKQVISQQDNQFKNRAIMRLVPYGILVLLNLSLLFPLLRWVLLRVFKPEAKRTVMKKHLALFGTGLLLDAVLVAQILSILLGTPVSMAVVMNPTVSFLIFLALLALSIAALLLMRSAHKKGIWTIGASRHYRLVAIGNTLLVFYMYYWNMGGMLA